jgi:hypothetical protein
MNLLISVTGGYSYDEDGTRQTIADFYTFEITTRVTALL